MPVIHIFHHGGGIESYRMLARVCADAAAVLDVPATKVWAMWHPVDKQMVHRPDWDASDKPGPIVRLFCRRSHSTARVQALMQGLRNGLADELGCTATSIFVQVVRVDDEEVLNVT